MGEVFRFRWRFASGRKKAAHADALEALARGDAAGAERELAHLLETATVASERAFLLNKRGVARVALARREAAREDFEAAVVCAGGYAPALTNLGNLHLEQGELDAAIARYEAAIAVDAHYQLAYVNLGTAHKRAGRLDDAVRALRRATAASARRRR